MYIYREGLYFHLQIRFLLALHISQEVVSLPLQLLGHLAASLLRKQTVDFIQLSNL